MWSWRNSAIVMTGLVTVSLLAAEQGKVNGRLSLGEATVPAQAEVEVMLLDVSQAGVSSLLVSQKKFKVGEEIPIAFTLTYDKAKIDATHDYAVSARITVDGRPRFISDKKSLVITKGKGVNVEVPMRSVSLGGAHK